MSAAQWVGRSAAAIVIFGGIWALLPSVPPGDYAFVIPDEVWIPLVSILELDRYLPIATLVTIAAAEWLYKSLILTWWVAGWVWGKVT